MVQPLFFEPDPNIEDSDLLGYGDLIFDNGSRQYVSGDPEIASYLPPAPVNAPELDMDAGVPSSDPLTSPEYVPSAPEPVQGQIPQVIPRMDAPPPVQVEGVTFDPATGEPIETEQGAMMGGPMEGPPQMPPQGGAPPPDLTQPVPVPGSQEYQVIPATGDIIQAGAGAAPGAGQGLGADGLQLVQREGALPPDLAAQQAAERQDLNSSLLAETALGRRAEVDIYRQAALQRQGQLDAEKQAREAEIKEQQAKLSRWQTEQQETAKMDIKTDLVSAEGGIGAMFSVIGAALLGAVGSDAGLRMIDNTIDQNVRKQMNQRDSRLRMLADRIGSTEQAIAAGKAALYKIAADKVEVTEKLTKADVFEAQTPGILAQLRQQQGLYDQEQQRISLGKTLEKAPVITPPKPADPAMVVKYGEEAQALQQGRSDLLKAVQAIGLEGWDPKTGRFANRASIKGLPGVGTWDAFQADLGRLPVVGALPQAIDTAVTSQQGLDLRTALQSLVEAKAMQRSPGRAPTEGDRLAARNELGFNTEKGVLDAVERMMGQQEQLHAQLVARYGPQVVQTYEERLGGQPQQPTAPGGPVDRGRPLEPGKAREQLQQEIQRAPQGQQSKLGGDVQDLTPSIHAYAELEGLNGDAIAKVIKPESGGSPSIENPLTKKDRHAGLIQFSQSTWPGVAKAAGRPDVSWDEMRKMTAEEQLPFVMAYFRERGLTDADSPGDYRMALFMPAYLRESDDFVLGDPGSDELLGGLRSSLIWKQNPSLRGPNGLITVGSVRQSVGG